MIICTNCGFENDDGSRFCGGCQEFLDWTGEAIESDGEEDTDPAVEEDVHRGLVERVVDRIRGPEDPERPDPDSTSRTVAPDQEPEAADPATALASETADRAERVAEAAEHRRVEAELWAREQTEATERARAHAEQAERARREAEGLARQEAAAAERIRTELEAARRVREEAESQLQRESQAAEQAREAAERQRADTAMVADEERKQTAEAERARVEAAERLRSEREAMERAEADLAQAEAARRAAAARAQAESDAAEAAHQAAAEAEAARVAAEEKATEEARAAEQARRAAALVARPQPAPRSTRRRRPDGDGPAPQPAREEAPSSTGPAPVKPDRTRARPAAKTGRPVPERRLRPGDLVCGQCGEGNTPTRNFCRRCGNTLAEAEVVRAPWWKRLVPRRQPKVYAAGARPSRGHPGDGGAVAAGTADGKGGGTKGVKGAVRGAQGLKRKVLGPIGKIGRPLMFVGVALAAIGISFNPGIRGSLTGGAGDLFDRVRGFIAPQFEPVVPVAVTASSSLPDHPPERAIDNTSNRWWAEGDPEGDGEGENLVVTFAEPVDIAVVGVTPGAAETEEFVAQPRPRQLHLVFDTGVTADLDLSDEHEFQSFEVDAPGVTSVEVQVIEVWQGQSGSDMAITTLEFRTAS